VREANRLVQQMFIEHARGVGAGADVRATTTVESQRF